MTHTAETARAVAETAERIVRQDVHLCLSSMVSTLANAAGSLSYEGETRELSILAGLALELSAPVLDYEEAARQAGWSNTGSVVECWRNEADHSGWAMDSAEEVCTEFDIEPYEWEVFEHWAVSSWLAEKLLAAGERVDTDFAGLNVWARTTTGQNISMDAVIQRIAADVVAA